VAIWQHMFVTPMAENPVIDVLRRGQESTNELTALLVHHKLPPEVTHLLQNISGVFSEAVAMSQTVAGSPELLPTTDENGMYTNSSKKRRIQVAPKSGGRKRYSQLDHFFYSLCSRNCLFHHSFWYVDGLMT
jgi:hypothetical protein